MRTRSSTWAMVAGAVLGGLIVGLFPSEPRWLWSVIGGVAGGALGLGAAGLAARRWHWALRALAVLVLLLLGFGCLFLVVGGRWILDPRNLQISSP
ncbi:MAG: hypothetical protein ACO1SX_19630 [Actinomycetota bacterium]